MEHKNQVIEIKELFKYLFHSDRRSQKKRGAVRIPVSFGQAEAEKERSCQNTGLIRTGGGRKREELSENRSHSDRRREKKRGAVRIPVSFGQAEAEKERGCQKTGLIPTGGG
jgi:hypothetical protein